MRILCPNCGFGREMDETKIPPRAQMATCPRCEHKFRFRVVDDLPPLDPEPKDHVHFGSSGGIPAGDIPADDAMAAQRAAAAAAWKHIQGVKDEARKPEDAQPVPVREEGEPAAADGAVQGLPSDAPSGPPPSQPHAQERLNVTVAELAGSPVPFEDLPRHGFFPGLWRTIMAVVKAPADFFSSMPVSGGMAKPLIFHLLLAEFMVLCQYLWGLTSLASVSQLADSPELLDMGIGMAGAAPILILVFYPLLLVLRLMLMTGVIHLLLRLLFRFTGGQGGGAEATFRVLCYSAAPLILGVIPFFGPLMGGIWSIGLTIIGLKEAHRTRLSAAAFAVLVPILMLLAAVLGVMHSGAKV